MASLQQEQRRLVPAAAATRPPSHSIDTYHYTYAAGFTSETGSEETGAELRGAAVADQAGAGAAAADPEPSVSSGEKAAVRSAAPSVPQGAPRPLEQHGYHSLATVVSAYRHVLVTGFAVFLVSLAACVVRAWLQYPT